MLDTDTPTTRARAACSSSGDGLLVVLLQGNSVVVVVGGDTKAATVPVVGDDTHTTVAKSRIQSRRRLVPLREYWDAIVLSLLCRCRLSALR